MHPGCSVFAPTSCLSDDVGMRVASVTILYIPATMWRSLSWGMELLSAIDLITSRQSFPSTALTTAASICKTSICWLQSCCYILRFYQPQIALSLRVQSSQISTARKPQIILLAPYLLTLYGC